jgi:hypothetical protein
MDKNISATIVEICKKLGIPYQSCNPNYVEFYNDAKRIGEIVMEVEGLIDELDCILIRHKVQSFTKNQIEEDLQELHRIDHDLINLAQKIKKEND